MDKAKGALEKANFKWEQILKKYLAQVPAAKAEAYKAMAKDQMKMYREFKDKMQASDQLPKIEKAIMLKKAAAEYEAKDTELFDKHKWSSCWLIGQLVHAEYKSDATMNEQFKQHCPDFYNVQK